MKNSKTSKYKFCEDIGTNSNALVVGKDGRIIDTCLEIFPEGVSIDKSGKETSFNMQRREHRSKKRMKARHQKNIRNLKRILNSMKQELISKSN